MLQFYQICVAYLNMEFCTSHRAAYEKLSDDVPFELPKGWMWCRLGEIAEVQLGKMLDRKKTNGTPLPYLANVSVRWGEFDLLALKTMPFSECEKEKFALRPGDILMCEGGVPGRCAIWREPDSIIKYQKALHRIRLKTVSAEYIRYFFEAIHDTMFFTKRFSGSTIHHLPREMLIQVPIPLPPLTEQKRIVASIEELFKIADRLGEAADGLETAAKHLDKKILDLAIRGKLVPQNPNDEPASELLKRIATTSHKSPCKNHEKPIDPPFEIPDSWEWTTLRRVCSVISKGTTPKGGSKGYSKRGVTFIRAENVCSDGRLRLDNAKFIEEESHYKELSRSILEYGDVLITIAGSLGRSAVVSRKVLPANTNQAVAFARPYDIQLSQFLQMAIMSVPMQTMLLSQQKVTGIPNLTLESISKLLIPLPPLAEQKRIVAKIEELRKVTQALTM